MPLGSCQDYVLASREDFTAHSQSQFEVGVKDALHQFVRALLLVAVDEHEIEGARHKLTTTTLRQEGRDDAVALLLTYYPEGVFVAV